MEEDSSRQTRVLVWIAAALCAVVVGYNAFYVPEASFSEPVAAADAGSAPAVSAVSSARSAKKLNINTASAAELSDGLAGVGDVLAERIVAYRGEHGPFRSVDELRNVPGIGEKKYEEIRGQVAVG
jgi:competence ComEA-like helix-hairpin-helix protein